MPRYENPSVPHEVNVGKVSPVGEFFRLAAVLAAFCIALVVAVYFGMRFLVPHIPFRYEAALAENLAAALDSEPSSPARQYLQALADSLAAHMALPEGATLTVHVSDEATPNAFATFGGHVIVTRGLLDLVDSENALAMVLAHEIGHIQHRDPLVAAGSGIVISLAMGVLFGTGDAGAIGNTSGLLTQLNFSRSQESAADRVALEALTQYYGHTRGAETFFKKMLDSHREGSAPPEFLNTHPDTAKRLAAIEAHYARVPDGELTPLPQLLAEERTKKKREADRDGEACPP